MVAPVWSAQSSMTHDGDEEDVQWIAGQNDGELLAHLQSGARVDFCGFPPKSVLSLDLREYHSGVTSVYGLPPSPSPHAVSLVSSGTPGVPFGANCTAVFFTLSAGQTARITFLPADECLRFDLTPTPYEDTDTLRTALHTRGVAVYTVPHAVSWRRLAGCIRPAHFARLCGCRFGEAVCGAEPSSSAAHESAPLPAAARPRRPCCLPLRFEGVPRVRRMDGMSPREVTEFNLDRSAFVQWLVVTRYEGCVDGLLCELQLSFCVFLLLRDAYGLEQWGALVRELCWCEQLFEDSPGLLSRVACTLQAQLEVVERDVVEEIGGDALQQVLMGFVARVRALHPAVAQLGLSLKSRFDWPEECEE